MQTCYYHLSQYIFSIAGAIFKRGICDLKNLNNHWGWCKCRLSRYWRKKCDWNFFEVDQALQMLRVALVTILALEMRLKFLEVDQALEMLRVPLVTILPREMRLKFFQVDQRLEMLRVALVTILARKCDWNFWSRPSFGDVPSCASHDIGARNAIESFLKSTKLWRCCEYRWSRYWREKCDWNFFKAINVWRCCECR